MYYNLIGVTNSIIIFANYLTNKFSIINSILRKPDTLGAIASGFCILHCLLTPLLFAAQSLSINNIEGASIWWKNLDFIFLIISFFAIYRSTKLSTNRLIKISFWIFWVIIFFLILNEKFLWFKIEEIFIFTTASTLICLHIYNLNFCQCKTDECCVSSNKVI